MRNKKGLTFILVVLSTTFLLLLSISMYISNKEKLEIKTVQELIINGDYDKAIDKINGSKDSGILSLYKNILEDFISLREDNDIESKKEKLLDFRKIYKNEIENNIFNILNKDILKIEEYISKYYEEISNEKEKLVKAIEDDINSAGELIQKFKEKYSKEDISEVEKIYIKKNEEINSRYSNKNTTLESNTQFNSKESGIGSTNAAKNSGQIVTVVSKGGSYGELAFWEKDNIGNWNEVDRVAARLGQNGLKSYSQVYEMDKSTPTGIYTLTEAFGINSNPGSGVTYRQLDGSEYWIDDENSQYYNTMQFGEANGRWASSEKLIDYTGYYNYSLVIDYNRWPVIPGKSSAIFIHCDMGIYTYGCVAIPQQNLENLLIKLNPSKNPVIILDFDYDNIYNNY